jgi:hypothetical protein
MLPKSHLLVFMMSSPLDQEGKLSSQAGTSFAVDGIGKGLLITEQDVCQVRANRVTGYFTDRFPECGMLGSTLPWEIMGISCMEGVQILYGGDSAECPMAGAGPAPEIATIRAAAKLGCRRAAVSARSPLRMVACVRVRRCLTSGYGG